MTKSVIQEACKKNGGYSQPHLNDQLYLHCKGFTNIGGLEDYKNVKVLWLEQNALTEIEGLEGLESLVTLFLHNNTIREINTGLSTLSRLRILNLSHNSISVIKNLTALTQLETLQISHNRISSLRDCEQLWQLPSLSCVDLSFNRIEREDDLDYSDGSALFGGGGASKSSGAAAPPPPVPEGLVDDNGVPVVYAPPEVQKKDLLLVNFFKRIPELNVLYLQGNDVARGMKNYRKNMVFHIKALTYLDELPVFPEERRSTEAWGTGGLEAERQERMKIQEEKNEQLTRCVKVTREMWENNREVRERRAAEWDEKQRIEREEQAARYAGYAKEQDAVLEEETQRRWEMLEHESKEIAKIQCDQEVDQEASQLAAEHRVKMEKEAEAQRLREEAAAAELQAEEDQRRAALRAKNATMAIDRQQWIDRFVQEDDEEEHAIQRRIDQVLAQLIPGAEGLAEDDNEAMMFVRPHQNVNAASASRAMRLFQQYKALESRRPASKSGAAAAAARPPIGDDDDDDQPADPSTVKRMRVEHMLRSEKIPTTRSPGTSPNAAAAVAAAPSTKHADPNAAGGDAPAKVEASPEKPAAVVKTWKQYYDFERRHRTPAVKSVE